MKFGRHSKNASDAVQDSKPKKEHKPSYLRRATDAWFNRLMGAAADGSFSGQDEEYNAHRTSQDYIWNTVGLASWGMVFPVLTVIITQLVGAEQAGMFSLVFVTGQLLMIIANYGVRTFQVSDLDQKHSFADYQLNRWLTCLIMMAVGMLYCSVRGYDGQMYVMSICVYLYKMIDGLADVYEGRLQQVDKLYLAGISQTVRSLGVFVLFVAFLLVTRDLGIASIAMAVAAVASFILFTYPLALFEAPKSRKVSLGSVKALFQQCFPLFLALFLYAFIDNIPKFVMEGQLPYDAQLYFNALYFPAQAILIVVGLIYKPMLVRMANTWADVERRHRFDLLIVAMMAIIVVITVVSIAIMGWIGIPIMSFLYGVDFEQFRKLAYMMILAGGVTGAIDFLYQVITVLRRQRTVIGFYLIVFCISLFLPYIMVRMIGLEGAVVSYCIVMGILFFLLAQEYVTVRVRLAKHPEREEEMATAGQMAAVAPSASVAGAPRETARSAKDINRDKAAHGHRSTTAAAQSARDAASKVGKLGKRFVPGVKKDSKGRAHKAATARDVKGKDASKIHEKREALRIEAEKRRRYGTHEPLPEREALRAEARRRMENEPDAPIEGAGSLIPEMGETLEQARKRSAESDSGQAPDTSRCDAEQEAQLQPAQSMSENADESQQSDENADGSQQSNSERENG